MTRRVRVLLGIGTLIAVALVGAAIAGAKSGQQNSHRQGKPGRAVVVARQRTTPRAKSAKVTEKPPPLGLRFIILRNPDTHGASRPDVQAHGLRAGSPRSCWATNDRGIHDPEAVG